MRRILHDIKSLFEIDVTDEGESNKLVKVLRSLEFAMLMFALALGIVAVSRGIYQEALFFTFVFVFAMSLIHMSYHAKVITQIVCVNMFTLVGVAVGYFWFGGEVHIQNVLFVLVVLAFFSQYGYYGLKAVYSAVVAIVYAVLEMMTGRMVPEVELPLFDLRFLEVGHIVLIFLCIGLICYIYSKDSQHLEGKLLEYNNLLKKQATTDALTGLCNRRSAMELIEKLINSSRDTAFCVCMCDIDFFKKINDSYGHDIGDNVLRGIANTMKEGFPSKCLISRWGGEEFLVILPEMNGDDAKVILDIMRSKLKKMEYRAGDKRFGVTMTFGLAEYGYDGDADGLVKEADNKLYYGKEHGRDQVVF